jgi:nucleotide-binding universal stress UspA family protein
VALKTILVGCDLSVPSAHAIARATALARMHVASLILVHAQREDEGHGVVGEVTAAVRAEEAVRLSATYDAIRARGISAELLVRSGAPGDVLAAVATERAADLVVVGTHGHGGVERLLLGKLGSVATHIVHSAPCDVLVVRGAAGTSAAPGQHDAVPDSEWVAFGSPIVGTDFSPAAEKALAHVADLVIEGAPIALVHAWQLPSGSWGATLLGAARFPWSTVRDAVIANAREQADALAAKRASVGHAVAVELVQGSPAEVIVQRATEHHHDLIALGAHGHKGLRRLLVGSVADRTIHHAPCSVLVVHGRAN